MIADILDTHTYAYMHNTHTHPQTHTQTHTQTQAHMHTHTLQGWPNADPNTYFGNRRGAAWSTLYHGTYMYGQYVTAVYDKRDSFNFSIVNFPYLSSNIPSKPAYGVYISQLVRIGRICDNFEQFNDRHYKLTSKLIKQGFWYTRLCYF